MAERMESHVIWVLRSHNYKKMSIDDLERMAALDVVWNLRNKGLHVARDHWASHDRELCYAHRKAREAIDRMLSKGTLRREGNKVMRANMGPSRECCYRVFSEVNLMDGPTYREICSDAWPRSDYHTE